MEEMTKVTCTNDIAQMLDKEVKNKTVRIGDVAVRLKGKTFMVYTHTFTSDFNLFMFDGISMQYGKAKFTISNGELYMSIVNRAA